MGLYLSFLNMLDYIITQRLIGKIFVGGAIKDDYFTSFCVLSVFKISLMCVYGFFFVFFCFFCNNNNNGLFI